jgi:SAM-dependent methyltransferase
MIHCQFCGGSCKKKFSHIPDTRFGIPGSWEIFSCQTCKMWQTNPLPSQDELIGLYETYYNFESAETKGSTYTLIRDALIPSSPFDLWLVLDGDVHFFLEKGNKDKRLLDIGCNEGRTLNVYSKNGFTCEGIELNKIAARKAINKGFKVHAIQLKDFSPTQKYDVVILSNVLEHELAPQKMLSLVKKMLKPDGELWISLPNRNSWLRSLFGKFWINWHVPFHLYHFNEATLASLLKNSGYELKQSENVTPSHWAGLSVISYFCSPQNRESSLMRNPIVIPLLMLIIRFFLFPILIFGNYTGQGDCLRIKAIPKQEK